MRPHLDLYLGSTIETMLNEKVQVPREEQDAERDAERDAAGHISPRRGIEDRAAELYLWGSWRI